jgi:hypothetical protein
LNLSNLGRIVIGLGYLASAVFNIVFTLRDPQPFLDYIVEYGSFDFINNLITKYIVPNSTMILVIIILCEIITGALILSKGIFIRIGLLLGIVWMIGLIPVPIAPPAVVNSMLSLILLLFLFGKHN